MSVSYSAIASLFRSTNKDKMEIKKLAFRSDGKEEFASSIDFSDAADVPNLPMAVVSPNITTIRFLCVTVTGGGTVTLRLISGNSVGMFIDVNVTDGNLLLSGIELTNVIVIAVSGLGFCSIMGSGD
jgi:hypothetical protein